jgi:hypothetical protein
VTPAIRPFAILLVALVCLPATVTAQSKATCLADWDSTTSGYDAANADVARAWEDLRADPEAARAKFAAAVTSMETFYSFATCVGITSITKRQADDLEIKRDALRMEAQCGWEISWLEGHVLNLQAVLDGYQKGQIPRASAQAQAEAARSTAQAILDEHKCRRVPRGIDYTRALLDWTGAVAEQMQQ